MQSLSRPSQTASSAPPLRWGFTTQNFLKFLPPTLEAARQFLTRAASLELQWIELRDPDASLTAEECRQLSSEARELGVEVNYSAQRSLLADDFWPVFERAVVNTACFDGPATLRVLALRGSRRFGWTKQEFEQMLKTVSEANAKALAAGLTLSVENADTSLWGGAGEDFALADLFRELDPAVRWQLDTANLLTTPGTVTPAQAETFVREFASRVSYLHIKTARQGTALPVLQDNPLPFERILSCLASHPRIYAAIELAPADTEAAGWDNLQTSLSYLRSSGLW